MRPHRAKIEEAVAEGIIDAFPYNGHIIAKRIVDVVLLHLMYQELPYAKDGMPTSETADILRFNNRLRDIIDEAI